VLRVTLFTMLDARSANFSVDKDSWKLEDSGESVASRKVLQLPPRESFSRYVSLESRYGTCVAQLVSAATTLTSAESDTFMACVSVALCMVGDSGLRSDPARSTRLILVRMTELQSTPNRCCRCSCKMACPRLES
jgi:hypothetical protein